MILLIFIGCFFALFLSKSSVLEHRPSMETEHYNFLLTWLSKTISQLLAFSWLTRSFFVNGYKQMPRILPFGTKTKNEKNNLEDEGQNYQVSLLDLPELALECILEKLSPAELCAMASVCSYMRDRCMSDHLWEKHMKKKWARLMGDAATKEWRSHVHLKRVCSRRSERGKADWGFKPFSWFSRNAKLRNVNGGKYRKRSSLLTVDSVMSWYLSLEHGKFLFPAQVYNRENEHVGFMMSCYDAKIRYDSKTDKFSARYSPMSSDRGRTQEEIVTWDRLRSPPVETPSRVLHVSDCLHDLRPGDHVEIQWRRSKDFPYGWWYGVVGHLENCDGDGKDCCCHSNDNVVVEFRQFKPESPWRTARISRKDHRETGNKPDGFYGGIRKLRSEEEISKWKCLWPAHVLLE